MNRGERLYKSRKKWISRAKRFYYTIMYNYWIPKDGVKANIPSIKSKEDRDRFFKKM